MIPEGRRSQLVFRVQRCRKESIWHVDASASDYECNIVRRTKVNDLGMNS